MGPFREGQGIATVSEHGAADQWLGLLLAGAAVLAYLAGLARLWRRGSAWPLSRPVWWVGGWLCVAVALAGPLAQRAHHDFVAHMATHVLVGMAAPLLLVSAAPVTLLLRVLPAARARPVARALSSPLVAVLTHPLTATLLSVGGLWALYRTGLHAATHADPWWRLVVTAHVLAAGYLFTYAVLGGPDPSPHRAPAAWRAGMSIAAIAAHNVLAKVLYAEPPPGVPTDQAQQAGQLMYYGGAPVELALVVLVCRTWPALSVSLGRGRKPPERA